MAQVYDLNNFVIDHVIRGLMTDPKTGEVKWSINQITNPSLSMTMDTSEVVDALGSTIASFDRAKKCEFSAENTIPDLSLLAGQNGVEKEVATEEIPIEVPAFETITVPADVSTPVVLAHTPKVIPTQIYMLKGDGTLGEVLAYSASTGAGKFTYDADTHAITFPTGTAAGTEYFVQYTYDSKRAVSVSGDAVNYPRAGRFVMEILGADVCDQSTLIHAYLILPNAKLDGNVDLGLQTDSTHPFKLMAQQAYCDKQKRLFQIVIPDEE